ncbi:MAG: beta-ketoacyl synthase N-terminal-like domain-containing protein [Pirellulaceae bacterium]
MTGVGLVTPTGIGPTAVQNALREGLSGVRFNADDVDRWRLQAYVPADFEPKQYVKARKSLKVMSHETQLGVAAASMAMTDAGWTAGALDPTRLGVILGTDIMHCPPAELIPTYAGSTDEAGFHFDRWGPMAQRELNPLWMLNYLPNMAASHIAISQDAQGPSNTLVLGDVSGLLAIAEGASLITRGWADVVIAGGTGSLRNPTTRMYHGVEHLSRRYETPLATPRPFDEQRDGSVAGEGAGIVILERRQVAEQRGARILGHCAGAGQGMVHRPGPNETRAIEIAARKAIEDAQWSVDSIDHVNAAGRATLVDDRREALACHKLFPNAPVTAPASFFGILGAASGAVEFISSLLLMSSGERPFTLHSSAAASDCPITLQTELAARRTGRFIKLSQCWTGQSIALAFEAN